MVRITGCLILVVLGLARADDAKPYLQLGHADHIDAVAFSPDGKFLVTGSRDRTARVWDVASGREIRRFEDSDWVKFVAFLPDGRAVLTGSRHAVRLWDVATGREVRRFELKAPNCVALAPDGRFILTGGSDNTARLWDLTTGQEVERFEGHSDEVIAVAFAPDGRSALTGSKDATLRLWEIVARGSAQGRADLGVASGHEVRRFESQPAEASSVVAFSRDGRFVASSGEGVRLWDAATGQE